ncbi:hypothetical protein U9M48_011375 [Paspalum notatum var. saurae]|uniref:Transposase n=1 Tax=Paspalum notatum var. saurae TaxID=547442 RepID=A0AAQ3SV80_PASNO
MYTFSILAYEKVNAEPESSRGCNEATTVEQVVENNVNQVNKVGVDIDEQGEASETIREPRGEVDEGEEIPGLVEQMQWEDTEANVPVDEDSDNEDETLKQVPSQWANYDHSQLLVNEGETVPWEYSENEVSVRAIYHSKIELKKAVQRWSAKCLKKEFRVHKSSPQVYDVKIGKMCVIHDRHGGIMQAVQDLQEGSVQRQRTPKWVDLKSRWCMRYMGANFQKQFKNKNLTKLFKRLCSQNQERKFNVLWKKLYEHTKKRATELSSRGVNLEDDEPVAMENVGLDGPNVRRRPGRSIKSFSKWIEHEPKEKWSLLHDEGGARYGIMTTNLAEVYNWVLCGSRSMPLVGIVEFYIYRTTQYFRERHPTAKKVFLDHRLIYGQKFFEYMAKANKKAAGHRVRNTGVAEH